MAARPLARLPAARRWAAALLALVLLAVSWPGAAAAQSLDQLRSQGVVGERYDGYAVVRSPGAPAATQSFVAGVNAKRRAIYDQRAKQQNVAPAQVGQIYAKHIFDGAPPGTWFLDAAGKWIKK